MKIQRPHKKKRIEIFLSQLLIIRYKNKIYLYTYVFEDDKKDEIF